jgi:hypothetical protein
MKYGTLQESPCTQDSGDREIDSPEPLVSQENPWASLASWTNGLEKGRRCAVAMDSISFEIVI